MATYFFDTSALVKTYVSEVGTAWAKSIVDPLAGNDICILRVTEVEMTSALVRRRNSGSLSAAATTTLLADFRSDAANEFIVIEVSQTVLRQATLLVEQHSLRAYDAIQLAAGLELDDVRSSAGLSAAILVSADQEMNAAARAIGLTVEDPSDHP